MSKFSKGDRVKIVADNTPEQVGGHLIGLTAVVRHVRTGKGNHYIGSDYKYEIDLDVSGRGVLANADELEAYRPELLNEETEKLTATFVAGGPKVDTSKYTGSKKGVAHYAAGMPEGIEPMDIIREQGYAYEFAWGNALKYLCRAQYKGSQLVDLKKASDYLNEAIQAFEAKEQA